MLLLRTNIKVIKFIKRMLSDNFDMKNLGIANVILGKNVGVDDVILEIKITRTPDRISLS